jgi:phage terminase large subunit-like protein
MPKWETSCPNWQDKLINHESIIPPPIYPEIAEHALSFFKELRVSDLPGKPTFGECSEDWVFDFVKVIFGGYDTQTGKQLIREYGLLISKKNTKSTIAAGIMLTALILSFREDEEHLILAPTKEVADNSFKPAAGMIRADEELSDMFQIQDHIRTITHRVNRNTLKVVAADTDTVSGKKSGRVLVDELWLFGKRGNAESMFMEALGGQVSRDEGWVIFLTTQSDEPPAGVFKERLDYWGSVRDGKINDPKTLGILYEYPENLIETKAYLEPEFFYITNPNIGKSVSLEWITDQLLKNQNKTDGTLQQFLAKHLNVEIGLNLRSDRWAGVDFWDIQKRDVSYHDLISRSEVVTVGIDGGGLDDLLGLYVIGRDKNTREWIGWGHAWAHEIAIKRRKSEESRLNDFVKSGDLTIVRQVGQDTEELATYISQLHQAELLDKIGIDPSGVGQILDTLVEAGIPEDVIVGVSQGWRLGGAIKTTERKLAEGVLVHCEQPLMSWCVGNARVEPKGNAILITKQASGKGKIDPLMALFNAVSLMALNPSAKKQDYKVFFI